MNSDRLYISHILRAINRILDYTHGLSLDQFLSISLVIDAVIRNFEIIGEAKRISIDTTNQFPDSPWKRMGGLRDKLIHDYIKVNLETVWNVVVNTLPSQRTVIERILAS